MYETLPDYFSENFVLCEADTQTDRLGDKFEC